MPDSRNATTLPETEHEHPVDTLLASLTGIQGILNIASNDFDENLSGGPGFRSSERSINDSLIVCHRMATDARAALDTLLEDFEVVLLTDAQKLAKTEDEERIRRKAAVLDSPRVGVGMPRAG